MAKTFLKLLSSSLLSVILLSVAGTAVAAFPSVQTNNASDIQNTSVTLNGYLSNLGGYGSATVGFNWGTSSSYGNTTSSYSQNNTGSFSQPLTGLAPNTTYYYRAFSQNQEGISYGQQSTFTTGSSSSGQSNISIRDNFYSPATRYINVGDTVTWRNDGNMNHTVTGGSLNSGTLVPGASYSYTFNSAGTYTYNCQFHPNMQGTIVVGNGGGGSGQLSVQTNNATNTYNNQATLNGYVSGASNSAVWFQWGTNSTYNNSTSAQNISSSGNFSQTIYNLAPNTTYYYRAVAQGSSGFLVYGQERTLYTGSNGNNGGNQNYGNLTVQKQVINLTTGTLAWQTSTSARPGDLLSFSITLQSNGGDVQNVFVRDFLPANLIYRDSLTVNVSNYSGDIRNGITINTVSQNQPVIIAYQAQVSPNIPFGTTTITNQASITSSQSGNQTATATVFVTNSAVNGVGTGPGPVFPTPTYPNPTAFPTGAGNDFAQNFSFIPLLAIILGLWLYFSGRAYKLADWIKVKVKR